MNPFVFVIFGAGALGYLLSRRTPRGAVTITDYTASSSNSSIIDSMVNTVSNLGKPRGVRNHNPGNLRYIDPTKSDPWNGQIGNDGGDYGVYLTDELGLRAMAKQTAKHMRNGKNTVRKLISTYAPATENDTESYIRAVAGALGVALTGNPPDSSTLTLDRGTLFTLMRAMIRHEVGAKWAGYYSDAQIRAAVSEAV